MFKTYKKNLLPVLVLLGHLIVLVLLLVRLGAPLGRHLLAEITEGDIRVLGPHAVPPLVQEVDIAAERLLRRPQSLGIAPFALRPATILRLVLIGLSEGPGFLLAIVRRRDLTSLDA